MAPNLEASGPDLLMDAWCPVEATMTIKNRPHLAREQLVFPSPSAWVQVPLTPGIAAAPGHSQDTEKRSASVSIRRNLSAAAAPTAARKTCGLWQVRCRQPEKSFPLRISRFS